MKRRTIRPRENWEGAVEETGLIYHHTGAGVYWDESAYYSFTSKEVDLLEAATNEIQRMCLEAGQHIIDLKRYKELAIPESAWSAIEWAWKYEPPAIYGRMDLAFDGDGVPKLLEYNADTPTALLESAVTQWNWKEDRFEKDDQFNSIHERLVRKWKELKDYCASPIYFAHLNDKQAEDVMTATYMRETAREAGLNTEGIIIKDLGWNGSTFVDMDNCPIKSIFKLYPWEWLINEPFGSHALETIQTIQWIEPIWKMLWSNKGLLPILYELHPKSEFLLPAYFDSPHGMTDYVRKPLLSREGANVELHGSLIAENGGEYGEDGFIFQQRGPVWNDGSRFAVIGSWLVDGAAAGMGVRESDGPITNNLSRFVPHIFS